MGTFVKVVTYVGIFGGAGALLMNYAPSEDQIKADKVQKKGAYRYADSDAEKKANAFTSVMIAAASSQKTIYGKKQATEQKLHEKAKQYSVPVPIPDSKN